MSLLCTVVAILRSASLRLSYAGGPSAEKFTIRVKDVALHMRDSVAEFLTIL